MRAKKAVRIAALERKALEGVAGQVHRYHFADLGVSQATMERFGASGVFLAPGNSVET